MTIQRYYSEGRLVADNRGGLVNYADYIEEIQRLEAENGRLKSPVSDSELQLIWQPQGQLYRPEMRGLMQAFVDYRAQQAILAQDREKP